MRQIMLPRIKEKSRSTSQVEVTKLIQKDGIQNIYDRLWMYSVFLRIQKLVCVGYNGSKCNFSFTSKEQPESQLQSLCNERLSNVLKHVLRYGILSVWFGYKLGLRYGQCDIQKSDFSNL